MERVKIGGVGVWNASRTAVPIRNGCCVAGVATFATPVAPMAAVPFGKFMVMADLMLVALTVAVFTVLGLVVRAVGRL